jgi:acetylornithine deacetylase/succinyl-diaminopimelate desuccinylase-like protein
MSAPQPHELTEKSVAWFKDLLKIDTSNPPGDESRGIRFIAELLQSYGISSSIVHAVPGRDNLIAEIPGTGDPILLSSHIDVVPAEHPEAWTHAPWSGAEAGGSLWGRGAVDMKCKTIFDCVALIERAERKEAGRPLKMVVLADEEQGGTFGVSYMLAKHRERIAAPVVLNEVGGFVYWIAGSPLIPIQTGEKGTLQVKITLSGQGGHASMPLSSSIACVLPQVLIALEKIGSRYHATPSSRAFAKTIGEIAVLAPLGEALLHPDMAELALNAIPDLTMRAQLRAMFFTTCAATEIRYGEKRNVLSETGDIGLDIRFSEGESAQAIVAQIEQLVLAALPPQVRATIVQESLDPGYDIKLDHPAIQNITESVIAAWGPKLPGLKVTPYLLPASSDNMHYARAGMTPIGFAPLFFSAESPGMSLAHARDERVERAAFVEGLELYRQCVARLSTL